MPQSTLKTYQIGEKTFVIDHEMFGETEDEYRAEVERRYRHMRETGLHITQQEADDWINKLLNGEDPPLPEEHT